MNSATKESRRCCAALSVVSITRSNRFAGRRSRVGVVNSPLGDLLVALSERGIVLIHYLPGGDDLESTIAKLRLVLDPVEDRRSVKEVGTEIRRYLDGDADALRRNIDLSLAVSPFQKKVL